MSYLTFEEVAYTNRSLELLKMAQDYCDRMQEKYWMCFSTEQDMIPVYELPKKSHRGRVFAALTKNWMWILKIQHSKTRTVTFNLTPEGIYEALVEYERPQISSNRCEELDHLIKWLEKL